MAFELEDAPQNYIGKAQLKGMNPEFMDRFQQMAQDYFTQTGKPLKVNDAFRSHEAQAQAYQNKPNLAAKPGHSLHEQGLAMDIDDTQANELANMGLMDRYGFTRPMMTRTPGKKYEPWHIQLADSSKMEQRATKTAAETKPQGRFVLEDETPQRFSLEGPQAQPPAPSPTPQAGPQAGGGGGEMTPQAGKYIAPVTESPLWGKIREPLERGAKAIDETLFPAWPIPKEYAPTPAQSLLDMLYPKTQREAMIGGIAGLGTAMVKGEPASGGAGFVPRAGMEEATRKELSALEKVVGMERFSPEDMTQLMEVAKKQFGIDLTAPELTNSPTLKAHWVALAKTPGTPAERLASFIEQVRQPQVEAAVRRELQAISPMGASPYQVGGQARAAAQNIQAALEASRKTATGPMYEQAYANAQPVDVTPVFERIANHAKEYPHGDKRLGVLQDLGRLVTRETTDPKTGVTAILPETDLRVLHNAKTGIDGLMSRIKQDPELAVDKDLLRLFSSVKNQLVGQLEKSNPLYGRAQQTFRLLSKPINEFKYGNPDLSKMNRTELSLMARIAAKGEENVHETPSMIFREPPEVILKAKKYFDKQYPGTWDAIVRARLQEALDVAKDSVVARTGNMGLDFKRRIFNTESDRVKWRVALGPGKYNRLNQFMDVLEKTSRIVYTNSDTPFILEAQRVQAQGGAEELLKKIEQMPTSTVGVVKRGMQWIARTFDKTKDPAFQAQLTDAMLDPKNVIEISRLARLSNPGKQVMDTAEFLNKVSAVELKDLTGDIRGRQKRNIEGKQLPEDIDR